MNEDNARYLTDIRESSCCDCLMEDGSEACQYCIKNFSNPKDEYPYEDCFRPKMHF